MVVIVKDEGREYEERYDDSGVEDDMTRGRQWRTRGRGTTR